jgi:ApaG protein
VAAYEMSVSVVTQYLQEQSNPDQANFVFAYTITIKNTGTVSAQVISRHWIITDAKNHIEEVKGLGWSGISRFWRQDKVLNTPAAVP